MDYSLFYVKDPNLWNEIWHINEIMDLRQDLSLLKLENGLRHLSASKQTLTYGVRQTVIED